MANYKPITESYYSHIIKGRQPTQHPIVCTHMNAHFLGVEVGVCPLFGVVLPLVLGQCTRPTDSNIIGVKCCVDHKFTIIHQTGIIDGWKVTANCLTYFLELTPCIHYIYMYVKIGYFLKQKKMYEMHHNTASAIQTKEKYEA